MESVYVYDGPVRAAMLDWKLRGRDAGMAWLLHAAAGHLRALFASDDVLIPVPMPITRMRRTGMHHTASLCRAIARLTGARVETGWLCRAADSSRQSSHDRAGRWKHARRAFRVNPDARPGAPAGARLWVVDDIRTTGATLHWACRKLAVGTQGCGIQAFSLARTPREG